MKFRALLCGHDPCDPPEATLVLAAAAAFNGVLGNGGPMRDGALRHDPRLSEMAEELGLHIGAIRRGVHHLQKVGAIKLELGRIAVEPEALSRRWENHRLRLRITGEARELGMRSEPLLLTALVAGQVDQKGQLMLGVEFLAERTGFARRTVERTLACARAAGAIHTWSRFTRSGGFRQQLWLALGPSQSGGSRASQSGGSGGGSTPAPTAPSRKPAVTPSQSGGHPVANRRSPHRETAVTPSQSGGRHPDLPPEYHPDHHPDRADARQRIVGDTEAEPLKAPAAQRPQQPAAAPVAAAPVLAPSPERQRQIVEAWVLAFVRKGVERMEHCHAADVAGLLDQFSRPPAEADLRRLAGLRSDRLALARRIIVWCPSPERLGRWLVRASRWFGVQNLGAYLRRASERGDPGTVLNRRHGPENVFSQQTERRLEGPHADNVARLVAGTAAVLQSTDETERAHLRGQLRDLLAARRPADARAVLLQLVGNERSDIAIARAIGDVCTLSRAKELLVA